MTHYQLARLQLANFQPPRLVAGHDKSNAAGDGAPALRLAKRHLETAIDLSPSFVQAQLALGEIELAQQRASEAARLFAKAAEMRPDLPQPRAGEARALLDSGRHLDARRKLEQASRDFPHDPEIAHLLARVLATAPAPRVRDGKRALELARSGILSLLPEAPSRTSSGNSGMSATTRVCSRPSSRDLRTPTS